MGRKPTIDKACLLDAAEQIIYTRGASALSFDAVAKAAGVSKGGVQNAFGTKEALLLALFDHLDGGYELRLSQAKNAGASDVNAYIDAVLSAQDTVKQRVAALSLTMTQEPESRGYLAKWYAQCFAALDADTQQGRNEILRLCALEGALMLRSMKLLPLDDQAWAKVLDELKSLGE